MRTNIELDPKLVREAQKLTGLPTKRQIVDEALRTLIRIRKKRSIVDLLGKVQFDENYDYREKRKR